MRGQDVPLRLHTQPRIRHEKSCWPAAWAPIFQLARVVAQRRGLRHPRAGIHHAGMVPSGRSLADLMDGNRGLPSARYCRPKWVAAASCTKLDRFDRITVAQAFAQWVGVDLLASVEDAARLAADANVRLRDGETWEDLFFPAAAGTGGTAAWAANAPTFPHPIGRPPQAALARRDPADARVALRFRNLRMRPRIGELPSKNSRMRPNSGPDSLLIAHDATLWRRRLGLWTRIFWPP